MNKHQLTYIDLYPAPVERDPAPVERDPSALAIWAGAALALIALYLLTVFLFTL
jgi:hypothetical protein